MGYIDPITELLPLKQQQRIAKLFRFGTPEEIEHFEQSVVSKKTKSKGDNPTKQPISNLSRNKNNMIFKVRRKILSLKRKAKKVTNLKKKRVQKQIKKKNLKDFKWHKDTPESLQNEIKEIVKDLHKRKGFYVAYEIKQILERYQDRIGREKFDIGRIDGIEYKITVRAVIFVVIIFVGSNFRGHIFRVGAI